MSVSNSLGIDKRPEKRTLSGVLEATMATAQSCPGQDETAEAGSSGRGEKALVWSCRAPFIKKGRWPTSYSPAGKACLDAITDLFNENCKELLLAECLTTQSGQTHQEPQGNNSVQEAVNVGYWMGHYLVMRHGQSTSRENHIFDSL